MTHDQVLQTILAERGYFVCGSQEKYPLPTPVDLRNEHYPPIDTDQPFTAIAYTDQADEAVQIEIVQCCFAPDVIVSPFRPFAYYYRCVTD